MRQTVCDRCHEVVKDRDEKAVRDLALVDSDGGMKMLGDICPSCIASLKGWLNPPRNGRRRSLPTLPLHSNSQGGE